MATPLGHALVASGIRVLLDETGKRGLTAPLLLGVLFSVAPDLDFLPGLLVGQPALYHQGISHSFAFALAASLVGAALFRVRGWSFARLFLLLTLSYLSHLALDILGPDSRPPYGLPLFWPLSTAHILSPVPLMLGMHHAAATDASVTQWIRGILSLYNIAALWVEALVGGSFLVIAGWWRRRNSKKPV